MRILAWTPCLCPHPLQSPELTLSQKIKAKLQNPDLLELCHLVPKEVVQLGEAWSGEMCVVGGSARWPMISASASVRFWEAVLLA